MAKKKKEAEPSKHKGVVFLPQGFSYGFQKMKDEVKAKRDERRGESKER